MADRYDGLIKIPAQPASRLLALANVTLDYKVKAPASADVATVLRELDAAYEPAEIIRVLSAALPLREGVWWACLAARDLLGPEARPTRTLSTSEAWVFDPSDANRKAAREALDAVAPEDPAMLCASAVSMCDGKLGPGDLQQYDAPPGASQISVFGMVMMSLAARDDAFFHQIQLLIERALDIARGGNGTIDPASVDPWMPPDDPEEDDEDEDDEDWEDEDDPAADDDDDDDLRGTGLEDAGQPGAARAKDAAPANPATPDEESAP